MTERLHVAVWSDGAPLLLDGRQVPNWSHVFRLALEKRSVAVHTPCGAADGWPGNVAATVVAPRAERVVDDRMWTALARRPEPVFVEASALCPAVRHRFGLRPRSLPATASIRYRDPIARAALRPFVGVAGVAEDRHPLPLPRVVVRYVPPDPRRFTLAATDGAVRIARKIAARQVFAWRRRWEQGLVDLARSTDRLAALALGQMARSVTCRLHARQLRCDAVRLAGQLDQLAADAGAPPAADVARALRQASRGDGPLEGKDLAEQTCQLAADLPAIRQADALAAQPNGRDDWRAAPTVVVLALACRRMARGEPAAARAMLEDVCARRLDSARGGFVQAPEPERAGQIASHPIVTLALLALAGVIELDDWSPPLEAIDDLPSGGDAPALPWLVPASPPEVVLADVVGPDGSAAPAIWRQGRVTVLGYPALAVVGHAQGLPTLPLPLQDGTHHFAGLLEHVLCAIMGVAGGAAPSVVVRHDMDRPIADDDLERLLAAYDRLGVVASWYWIPGRTRPRQMRRLLAAGHEIGLHAVRTRDKPAELAAIGAIVGRPVAGETLHGAGADYHFGAPTAAAALDAGLTYAELSPLLYGLPAVGWPVVDQAGIITIRRGCTNLTFTYSTDTGPTSRKQEIAADPAFSLALLRAGYPAVVLNHPDMNRARLLEMVDACAALGATFVTAETLARRALAGVAGQAAP